MMAIKRQTNNSLSQVDSLAAFLSEWAEGSGRDHTTPQHQHRPFSLQPPTTLPSGVLRRRNDGYGNISNQLHEHEGAEEQILSRSSENGITLQSSPCGVRVVWHRESVPMVAGASGGNGVPPLPFAVTRNEQPTPQSQPPSSSRLATSNLDLEHHLQGVGVPSERSAPFRSYKRATRSSRRHSDPGTNLSCLY